MAGLAPEAFMTQSLANTKGLSRPSAVPRLSSAQRQCPRQAQDRNEPGASLSNPVHTTPTVASSSMETPQRVELPHLRRERRR